MNNYNSMQNLINASPDNFTVIRYNSKQDDGTETLNTIPSWIKVNAVVPSRMYVSGNSWVGFTSSEERFKVNRRDTALWYLWTEEGTLYDYFKFFRIRWKGYSTYSSTSESSLLQYDWIFWDTGDITLSMIDIPTSNYNGTFNVLSRSTYTYNPPTVNKPYVTFYSQDEDNSEFIVAYELPRLEIDKKFLVKEGTKFYTSLDSEITELAITELNSQSFRDYGFDNEEDIDLFKNLNNPVFYKWFEKDISIKPIFSIIEEATPKPQIIETEDYDMSHPSIKGINNVEAEGSNVLLSISFNSGGTWKVYSNNSWVNVSDTNPGMTIDEITQISSEAWNEIATTGRYKFRLHILDRSSILSKLKVNYIN